MFICTYKAILIAILIFNSHISIPLEMWEMWKQCVFGCWTELAGDELCVWRAVNNQGVLFTLPDWYKCKHTLLTRFRIRKRVEVACYLQQTR